MKAVIMAGGEGTRLRPLTCNRPKPMVPIANKPVMEHIVQLLKKHTFKEVAVTLQYMPGIIQDYFQDGSDFGLHMQYYVEQTPLGTAGSVKNAEDFLDDTFIVISGDALTDIDLTRAVEFHKSRQAVATLVLKKVDIPLEYGVVVTNQEGGITRFLEKPSWGEVFSDTVNTGIYILSPEVLGYFKKNEMFDFSKDLFPILMREKRPMYGYVTEDYWCDIGDLGAYLQSHMDILEGRMRIEMPGIQKTPGIWVGEGTEIHPDAVLKGPCIIGSGCSIRKDVFVGDYSVIGDSITIGERSSIKRSILWPHCIIERNVQLRGSVLCDKVNAKDGVSIFELSVIGDGTVIQEQAMVKPSIKVWPGKVVEADTEVNSNLVWGSKFTRTIFGNRGVAGEINVDITPEFASKLGAAYGAALKRNARIGISSDGSAAAQMLKISFMAGLLSSGKEVYDLRRLLLPMTRSAVRFYAVDGGIHISSNIERNGRLFVDFLDGNGSNISRTMERKIENMLIREDFSRCEGGDIREVRTIPDFSSFYIRSVVNSVRNKKLEYTIAMNASSDFVGEKMGEILQELGCRVIPVKRSITSSGAGTEFNDVHAMGEEVRRQGYDLGVSIEDNSEKMTLVDNMGRVITEDMFIALISVILFQNIQGGTMVVPVSASQVVEQLADLNKGRVLRSKTSDQDLMGKIFSSDLKEEMLEQFTMHYDAMAGLVKILDYVKTNGSTLADTVNMIPDFHMYRQEVACPWNAKGRVIRKIMQEGEGQEVETLEGVKIHREKGWVLILPDGERPVCKVIAEGATAEFAEELSAIYAEKIKEISRGS